LKPNSETYWTQEEIERALAQRELERLNEQQRVEFNLDPTQTIRAASHDGANGGTDVWIITDQGVIALAWEGWFHRTSMRTLYSDIQGVSYEINGIMGTLNGYGTLSMEKISTGGKVSLSHVRYPRKIQALILQNMESYLHKKNLKNAKHVQDLLAEFVAEKIQLSDIQGTEKHSAKEQTSGIIIRKV